MKFYLILNYLLIVITFLFSTTGNGHDLNQVAAAPFGSEHSDAKVSDSGFIKRPMFHVSPQNLSVPEGSDVKFPCDYGYKETQGNHYIDA